MTTELDSAATLRTLSLATGSRIIDDICSTVLQNVKHEVVFATCFWAESDSLLSVTNLLYELSRKATAGSASRKINVRICLSSASFWQKIFHTSSVKGHLYHPSSWSQQLKLPALEDLPGLDLQIKSVFIKPFSVIHSKYVIIDRQIAILPSCNVSFEEWLEGAITVQGPLVGQLFNFWCSFWASGSSTFSLPDSIPTGTDGSFNYLKTNSILDKRQDRESEARLMSISVPAGNILAALLPSPHHRNPRFNLWPWQKVPEPPRTTLNQFTCQCIHKSKSKLFFQTPNFTCRAVIDAIFQALLRGIEVHIITNNKLMTLEQIITAGTTTPRSMRRLVRKYKKVDSLELTGTRMEEGRVELGKLKVIYFDRLRSQGKVTFLQTEKSHLKLTVVDEEITILGSGNMDRASWYTSQELGVAFHSADLSKDILRHTQHTLLEP